MTRGMSLHGLSPVTTDDTSYFDAHASQLSINTVTADFLQISIPLKAIAVTVNVCDLMCYVLHCAENI